VPAAAVIPAPIAYIKVVAVKKLVVEAIGGYLCVPVRHSPRRARPARAVCGGVCMTVWHVPRITMC
jgi:hypothetical protein